MTNPPLNGHRAYPCPRCGGNMGVVDSRPTTFMEEKTIRRRRSCSDRACNYRFSTYEISEDNLLARLRREEQMRAASDAITNAMIETTEKLRSLLK